MQSDTNAAKPVEGHHHLVHHMVKSDGDTWALDNAKRAHKMEKARLAEDLMTTTELAEKRGKNADGLNAAINESKEDMAKMTE